MSFKVIKSGTNRKPAYDFLAFLLVLLRATERKTKTDSLRSVEHGICPIASLNVTN